MKRFLFIGSILLSSIFTSGCYHHMAAVGYSSGYYDDSYGYYNDYGYYYGSFNQSGYYYNNIFFPYDTYYTYPDRLHRRGYFAPSHRHHRRDHAPARINNHYNDRHRFTPSRQERLDYNQDWHHFTPSRQERIHNHYQPDRGRITRERFPDTKKPKVSNERQRDTTSRTNIKRDNIRRDRDNRRDKDKSRHEERRERNHRH